MDSHADERFDKPNAVSQAWIPGLQLFKSYRRTDFPHDFVAGLVVVLVLIPSAIAYADLARCPPVSGLYAALGGMVVFALFTSSRHVVAGPDAAIAILVGSSAGSLAHGDPAQALALSTWLALLTGAFLLLAAYFQLGAVADFLANPVMLGFMNGAAVVIIASQLGKLFGIGLQEENSLLRFVEWGQRLGETQVLVLALGLACMAFLWMMRLWWPRVPGTIVLFALALLAGRLIEFPSHGFAVIGTVDTSIPDPIPPQLSFSELGQLVVSALGIALLVFPEGIVLGRSIAARHQYSIDSDRELVALGLSNLAAGLLHSFSVGASQTRSLLNDATGGRTQMVSLIAAVLLVAFLYFLASWIANIPIVVIAAILTFTGLTLIDTQSVRKFGVMRRFDARVANLTSICVVAFGVLPGILFGVILSLLRVIRQVARPNDALLGRIEGSPTFHDVGDDESAQTVPGLVIYRFYGPLIFANVRYFTERCEAFMAREKEPVRQVILDARAIPEMDVTAAEALKAWIEQLQKRGIRFIVAKAHLPLRQAAQQVGLAELGATETSFNQLPEAIADFLARFPRK